MNDATTGADACADALNVPSTRMISNMAAFTSSGTVAMPATRPWVRLSIRFLAFISASI